VGSSKVEIIRASRALESVEVPEMRLIRRLHVDVVGVLDRAESVRETVQFVMGQQLLVKIIVERSLTNLALLRVNALLLVLMLVLYRGLLRLL